jgi:hypothetical protein
MAAMEMPVGSFCTTSATWDGNAKSWSKRKRDQTLPCTGRSEVEIDDWLLGQSQAGPPKRYCGNGRGRAGGAGILGVLSGATGAGMVEEGVE